MITSVSASFCWKQEMISGCSMAPHPSGTSVSGFCCLFHSSLACEEKLQSRTHRAFIPHIRSVMRFPPTYWLVGLNLRGCPFRTGSNSATSWTSSTKHVRMPPPPQEMMQQIWVQLFHSCYLLPLPHLWVKLANMRICRSRVTRFGRKAAKKHKASRQTPTLNNWATHVLFSCL